MQGNLNPLAHALASQEKIKAQQNIHKLFPHSSENDIALAIEDSGEQEAATTCFLENLVNAVAWKTIPASSFVNLLGSESKKYCKAWDTFTDS